MRKLFSFILISVVGLTVGCAQFNRGEKSYENIQSPAQTNNQENADLGPDEVIGQKVRKALNLANSIGTAGVVVEVSDGIVTLHGYAPDQGLAWQAEAAARSVQGVKEVYNQITLPGQ